MICKECEYEFNVVQCQVITDKEFLVQASQLYCPRCGALIHSHPQKIILSTKQREENNVGT